MSETNAPNTEDAPIYTDRHAITPFTETVEWQGKPAWRVLKADWFALYAAIGVGVCLFSLIWIWGVSQKSLFWTLPGWIIFLAGLYLIAFRPLGEAWRRSRTTYALTDKAAYIVETMPFYTRRHRIPYADLAPPKLEQTEPPTLWLGEEDRLLYSIGNGPDAKRKTYRAKFGFRFVDDAARAARMINARR